MAKMKIVICHQVTILIAQFSVQLKVEPGGQINWSDNVYIPRATPTTLDNCRIITVSYQLNVKVVIAWATNIIISAPIVIGNAPVQLTETSTNI